MACAQECVGNAEESGPKRDGWHKILTSAAGQVSRRLLVQFMGRIKLRSSISLLKIIYTCIIHSLLTCMMPADLMERWDEDDLIQVFVQHQQLRYYIHLTAIGFDQIKRPG